MTWILKDTGDIEVEKHRFHQQESPILITDANINNIVVSSKVPFGKIFFEYLLHWLQR